MRRTRARRTRYWIIAAIVIFLVVLELGRLGASGFH